MSKLLRLITASDFSGINIVPSSSSSEDIINFFQLGEDFGANFAGDVEDVGAGSAGEAEAAGTLFDTQKIATSRTEPHDEFIEGFSFYMKIFLSRLKEDS